jgi:hypothetical protein
LSFTSGTLHASRRFGQNGRTLIGEGVIPSKSPVDDFFTVDGNVAISGESIEGGIKSADMEPHSTTGEFFGVTNNRVAVHSSAS